jgi:hypothetical protein
MVAWCSLAQGHQDAWWEDGNILFLDAVIAQMYTFFKSHLKWGMLKMGEFYCMQIPLQRS